MIKNIVNDYKIDKLYVYLSVSLLCFCVFIFLSLLTNGQTIKWASFGVGYNFHFSDYFRQIVYASDLKNIYFNTNDAPFPPLAYCFYHLIYMLCSFDAKIELSSYMIARSYRTHQIIFLLRN